MRRRILILLVAALLAGFSALAVVAYGRSADLRALNGREGRWVLLATKAIPADTPVADLKAKGLVRRVLMPADTVPDGALSSLESVPASGQVNAALNPDQIVMRGIFVAAASPSPSPSSTFSLPPDRLAVSVDLGMAPQVAGNVDKGDQVTVFLTFPKQETETKPQVTVVLLPDVQVISVGESPEPSASASAPVSPSPEQTTPPVAGLTAEAGVENLQRYVVTLAVTQREGQLLIHGYNVGFLHLGLLGAKASATAPPDLDQILASEGAG